MTNERKRTVEVRLIVIVWVDLTDDTLAEALSAPATQRPSIADVVSSEIASNLESVAYVQNAVVSQL